jgi:predicted kinase
MPEIVFLIGFPGSGKSTYYNENYPSYTRISSDMFIESYANAVGKTYSDVFPIYYKTAETNMNELFDYSIKHNKDIVVDRTNLYTKSRNKFISRLPKSYTVTYVYFDISKDVLLERNTERKQFGRNVPENVFDQTPQLPDNYRSVTDE